MKREKRLTKRERKLQAPPPPAPTPPQVAATDATTTRPAETPAQGPPHIHCVACGRHIDPQDFQRPAKATIVTCQHQSKFAACVRCVEKARIMLDEHDRSGKPVQPSKPWH